MKNKILLTFLLSLFYSIIYAQNTNADISTGDTFVINKVHNNSYEYINFPKDNFIRKKGGMASYTNIIGEKVEVTSVKKKNDGRLVATIKLTSGKSFFNSHKYVTVAIEKAISKKELTKI